jgi:hypothetical protein
MCKEKINPRKLLNVIMDIPDRFIARWCGYRLSIMKLNPNNFEIEVETTRGDELMYVEKELESMEKAIEFGTCQLIRYRGKANEAKIV